jgi:DNA invertase Pin-like site-specific DNA recombinase
MLTKRLSLIAYVRSSDADPDKAEQVAAIKDYCRPRNYKLLATFSDAGEPGLGLHEAIECLKFADGLIAYDTSRLVTHHGDSFRDLRFFAHKFMRENKKLITVADGIENVTPAGQANLISLLSEWSRRQELRAEGIDLTTGNELDPYATRR